jgi:hypothetical protein
MVDTASERRLEERFDCHRHASILFGGRLLEATLRSISASGARLEMPRAPYGLPTELDLYLQGDATCYPVRVVWQSGDRIGVVFRSMVRPDLALCSQSA